MLLSKCPCERLYRYFWLLCWYHVDFACSLFLLSILMLYHHFPFATEEQQQKCQAHLLFVEQELEASKGREQALQERILKEVNDSQERYITQLKHCSELEVFLILSASPFFFS